MGKRSDFEKHEKSQYLTPEAPVLALVPFLPKDGFSFAEPCAGDGRLVNHIENNTKGRGVLISDIDPIGVAQVAEEKYGGVQRLDVCQRDALEITESDLNALNVDMVITNPPWERTKARGYILHRLIEHYSSKVRTWFLFDGDWAHTAQAQPYLEQYCTRIVSVGRVKWMPDSKHTGKDNACWYEFHPRAYQINRAPLFYGRGVSPIPCD